MQAIATVKAEGTEYAVTIASHRPGDEVAYFAASIDARQAGEQPEELGRAETVAGAMELIGEEIDLRLAQCGEPR